MLHNGTHSPLFRQGFDEHGFGMSQRNPVQFLSHSQLAVDGLFCTHRPSFKQGFGKQMLSI